MTEWLPSFCEELTKIADELPKSEKAKQYLQFGVLGAASGPVIGGISNMIQRGSFTPSGVSMKRWVPAQLVTGALLGGALPILREKLTEHTLGKLKQRQQTEKTLKEWAPEGPSLALSHLQKKAPLVSL